MQLKPRHYILILVLVGLAIFNYLRRERAAAPTVAHGPFTPAWQAFDQAADQRGAPDAQFSPALEALRTEANNASGPDAPDLRNCLMWLQYYRHSAPTAGGNAKNWGMLATSHVQSCRSQHRDLGR